MTLGCQRCTSGTRVNGADDLGEEPLAEAANHEREHRSGSTRFARVETLSHRLAELGAPSELSVVPVPAEQPPVGLIDRRLRLGFNP